MHLLQLPDLEGFVYVTEYLNELGYFESGGMGLGILSHKEIKAWAELTETELNHWEVKAIRHLSACYIDQDRKSEEASCPAPYVPEIEATDDVRAKVDKFFKDLLARRGKK